MCPKSPLLQTNFNLHQEKLNATENSKQSIYVRLDWVWRWLHHVAPCNAVRDDWCYTIKIWLTQPSGTADHFVRGPDLFFDFFPVLGTYFLDLLFCLFSLQFAAIWSWKLPSQRCCKIMEFESFIFHDICNILRSNCSCWMVFCDWDHLGCV